MSQKLWSIAFAPAGEGRYHVTVRRSGAVHRFDTALPPDISDLWAPPADGAAPTRSFRGNVAAMSPEARFFSAGNLPTLKDIGDRMLGAIFDLANPGEGPKLVGALEDRIADNDGIELQIDLSQAAELSGIPWESLYLRSKDRFLAIGTTSNIVRRLDAQSELPPPIERPIRVLVAAANPHADLDTTLELGNIERRIAELVGEGDHDFVIASLPKATRDDFRRKVRDWKPHIIHYIGHSAFIENSGYLYFETAKAGQKHDRVDAETLRNMLLNFRPWLVVLNSCESGLTSAAAPMAGVAQNLLVRLNIPFVVAMQHPVSDDAAISFSQDFYAALTDGRSISDAVTLGRNAIASNADERTQVELITPALYTSGETDRIAFTADAAAAAPVVATAVAGDAGAAEPGVPATPEKTGLFSKIELSGNRVVALVGIAVAVSAGLVATRDNIKELIGWDSGPPAEQRADVAPDAPDAPAPGVPASEVASEDMFAAEEAPVESSAAAVALSPGEPARVPSVGAVHVAESPPQAAPSIDAMPMPLESVEFADIPIPPPPPPPPSPPPPPPPPQSVFAEELPAEELLAMESSPYAAYAVAPLLAVAPTSGPTAWMPPALCQGAAGTIPFATGSADLSLTGRLAFAKATDAIAKCAPQAIEVRAFAADGGLDMARARANAIAALLFDSDAARGVAMTVAIAAPVIGQGADAVVGTPIGISPDIASGPAVDVVLTPYCVVGATPLVSIPFARDAEIDAVAASGVEAVPTLTATMIGDDQQVVLSGRANSDSLVAHQLTVARLNAVAAKLWGDRGIAAEALVLRDIGTACADTAAANPSPEDGRVDVSVVPRAATTP